MRVEDEARPFAWVWWLPALLVGAGVVFESVAASAFGIGLAAALSLSGSV
jgi:hypothetical protein